MSNKLSTDWMDGTNPEVSFVCNGKTNFELDKVSLKHQHIWQQNFLIPWLTAETRLFQIIYSCPHCVVIPFENIIWNMLGRRIVQLFCKGAVRYILYTYCKMGKLEKRPLRDKDKNIMVFQIEHFWTEPFCIYIHEMILFIYERKYIDDTFVLQNGVFRTVLKAKVEDKRNNLRNYLFVN